MKYVKYEMYQKIYKIYTIYEIYEYIKLWNLTHAVLFLFCEASVILNFEIERFLKLVIGTSHFEENKYNIENICMGD